MSEHTPGPWEVDAGLATDWIAFRVAAGSRLTETVCDTVDGDESERQANARLIAAAPDMLETLKEIRTYFEYTDGVDDENASIVIEAIEKAEGK